MCLRNSPIYEETIFHSFYHTDMPPLEGLINISQGIMAAMQMVVSHDYSSHGFPYSVAMTYACPYVTV